MMERRGQLSITVILALIIVGVVLIVVFLAPRLNIFVTDVNPSSFLRNCIEDDVVEIKDVLSRQGGYSSPENYVLHDGEMIQYLCYTTENYKPCVVQQPLLVDHVKGEIRSHVEPRARQCMTDLAEEYDRKGYSVQTTPGEIEVDIIPGSIVVEFLAPISVSKEDSVQSFQKFAVGVDREWYDLLLNAISILQFESTLGDSETTLYIQYYPDLKINKLKDDGDTLYTLSNVVTGDEFTFASRSLVWPAGYGIEEL
jgi:hypothetical protein